MPSVAVRLDAETKNSLEKIGKAQDRSPHYLMKKAIEDFVSKEQERQAELAISEERWRAYQLTGEAIPHEDAVDYFEKLIVKNG